MFLYFLFCVAAVAMPSLFGLKKIHQVCTQFSSGKWDTRLVLHQYSLLYPVSSTFNLLAEKVERLVKAQQILSYGISHDLRTPLSRIKYSAEILELGCRDKGQLKLLNEMKQDIAEIDSMLSEHLYLAMLDRVYRPKVISVEDIEQWVYQLKEKYARYDFISFQFSVHDYALLPELDLVQLSRAISNIIDNAIRFKHTQVVVAIMVSNEHLDVTVDNDGPALAADKWNGLVEPFVSDHTDSGHGLGLAIVNKVVELHGGRFSLVHSDLKGAAVGATIPI